MPIEIERKFVVQDDLPEWAPYVISSTAWSIHQGYITSPGADPEVRVRRAEMIDPDSALGDSPRPVSDADETTVFRRLTTKASIRTNDSGGVSRHEIEVAISEPEFGELWPITEGRQIRKVRIEHVMDIPTGGARVVTVDHFRGVLQGLVLAEIEFAKWSDSQAYVPPGFLGREVTHDPRYRNATLAGMTGRPIDPPSDQAEL